MRVRTGGELEAGRVMVVERRAGLELRQRDLTQTAVEQCEVCAIGDQDQWEALLLASSLQEATDLGQRLEALSAGQIVDQYESVGLTNETFEVTVCGELLWSDGLLGEIQQLVVLVQVQQTIHTEIVQFALPGGVHPGNRVQPIALCSAAFLCLCCCLFAGEQLSFSLFSLSAVSFIVSVIIIIIIINVHLSAAVSASSTTTTPITAAVAWLCYSAPC
mmetsp:Transcript_2046/g.6440  ORF Transcript_2046/g.6440 Transcript_2046/m.6440 type:complete len:218 (+) Transcript_2046:821-1474(+)